MEKVCRDAVVNRLMGHKDILTSEGQMKAVKGIEALAGVAQWIEHQPVNQKVTGSIPSQDTCLGFGPGP